MLPSTIGSFEAKTHFAQLLERVKQGEEFIITLRGAPVARIIAPTSNHDIQAAKQAAQQLRSLAQTLNLKDVSHAQWQAWRDEGKR